MKLADRTVLLVVISTVLFILLLYGFGYLVVQRGYLELEGEHCRDRVASAAVALKQRSDDLDVSVADWATWDDSYEFVAGDNDEFVAINLTEEAYAALRIHLLIIADTSGRIVASMYKDSQGNAIEPPEEEIRSLIARAYPMCDVGGEDPGVRGIIVLGGSPMFAAARRILTSAGDGPDHGMLIMGKRIDDVELDRVSQALGEKVSVVPFSDAITELNEAEQAVLLSSVTQEPLARFDGSRMHGYSPVSEMFAGRQLMVTIETEMLILERGVMTAHSFALMLALAGLVFGAVLLAVLKIGALSRLERLVKEVAELPGMGRPGAKVTVDGKDEITALATNINGLLAREAEADRALRESEVHFRTLADSGSALIWTSGVDGKCDFFNGPWLRFTGRSLEQELGDGWAEGVHPEDLENCITTYAKAFEKREPFSMSYRLKRHDGEYRWVQDDGAPRCNASGEFIGYIGHCLDVTAYREQERLREQAQKETARLLAETERSRTALLSMLEDQKQTEEELRASRMLLETSQRLARIGGWRWDCRRNEMSWTDETYRIHGLDRSQFSPGSAEHIAASLSCYDGVDADRVMAAFERCVSSGEPYDLEAAFTSVDGRNLKVRTSGIPVLEDGQVVAVGGNLMDITELRKLEAQYQTLFREMREGFALHEVVLDSGGLAVDYRFLSVNPAFEHLTGLRTSDVVGRTATDVFPTIDPKWIERYAKVALLGEPCIFEDLFPELDKHFQISAFSPEHGKFACIFTDVTQTRRLEEKIRQTEKLDAVGQLAGGVAHDINNQLTVIGGFLELVASGGDRATQRTFADQALTGVKKASALTKKLLTFARRSDFEVQPISIHKQIIEVVEVLKQTTDRRINIVTALEAEPDIVSGDASSICNALLNLGVNACDAMPSGGKLTISTSSDFCDTLSLERGDADSPRGISCITIRVTDSGVGMDKKTMARIFEPFFTTKPQGKGTGLGLATVYGCVRQHGGQVTVYSEPGVGTTFTIQLPLVQDDLALGAANVGPGAEIPEVPPLQIMLIDDEDGIRSICKELLEMMGHTVFDFADGPSAITHLKKHPGTVELVLLDMMMPVMSGADTYDGLKSVAPDLPVLLASGFSINGEAEDLIEKGVRGFIQKPYLSIDLKRKIAEALGLS